MYRVSVNEYRTPRVPAHPNQNLNDVSTEVCRMHYGIIFYLR